LKSGGAACAEADNIKALKAMKAIAIWICDKRKFWLLPKIELIPDFHNRYIKLACDCSAALVKLVVAALSLTIAINIMILFCHFECPI
jgi:hypothetical protein